MNSSGLQRLRAIRSTLSRVESFATPFVEMQTTSLNISKAVMRMKEIANTVDSPLDAIDERLELPHCTSFFFLIKLRAAILLFVRRNVYARSWHLVSHMHVYYYRNFKYIFLKLSK